ncbi:MAG: N-6 DNA methylase [Thermofilaceae archaeon]
MATRQEVLNVLLAQHLHERGIVAAPEQIINFPQQSRRMPDVLVDFQGLRLAIEGEFASPSAEKKASNAALQRVEQGIAHIGIALIYPEYLSSVSFDRLKEELTKAPLRFSIITEFCQPQLLEFPSHIPLFTDGDLNTLVEALRRAYEQLIHDEVLARAVALIEESIDRFIRAFTAQPAATERFNAALEIKEFPKDNSDEEQKDLLEENESDDNKVNNQPTPRQRDAINRVTALILINAMIFQEVLSQRERRVRPLQEFQNDSDPIGGLAAHWKYILDEINYYPIFHIAHKLLCCMSADRNATEAVKSLLSTSRQIVGWRAPLRHDLAGRMYHRLLSEAKYLGAYYTSIPAAVLLLKLALRSDFWNHNWADLEALKRFRIADFACGTGTLLMAAADAIVDNYIRACAQQGKQPDIDNLHSLLLSNVLYGFDVLDSAVHLTASTLMLRNPEIPINITHLGKCALGGEEQSLGSLEFILKNGFFFNQPEMVKGKESSQVAPEILPSLDLCVMNPPFTRSVGGNLLFGNLPAKERKGLQKKLQNVVKSQRLPASITAGLGSVFITLADKYLKEQGRLALVVPRALLSGAAWKRTRELFQKNYHLEFLIVSHEPGRWNFSENTNLSEVLLVARKRCDTENEERVICANLWRQPRNAVEALAVAKVLIEGDPPDVYKDQGALEIVVGNDKLGEVLSVPWSDLRQRLWNFPCAFAQTELVRSLFHLLKGDCYLPTKGIVSERKIPLCPLKKLGKLGFDVRDIHDGFELSSSKTAYPALWGHDANMVTTLTQIPKHYLQPRAHAKEGRPLRRATDLWQKAGRTVIVERLRLNTMRLASVFSYEKVLAAQWWTFVPHTQDIDAEKALVIWLNSTLGLLMLLGHRTETEGAWVKFKKPVLEQMPVLDVRSINESARRKLVQAFDQLAQKPLLPFPDIEKDPTRAAIDKAVADALDLPDLGILRKLLASEPIICLSLDRLLL